MLRLVLKFPEDDIADHSRVIAVRIALFYMRILEEWKTALPDYESVAIMFAVISVNAERLTRMTVPAELRSLDHPLSGDWVARCNYSSIASATGMSRETVRRKVKRLVEMGILSRVDDEGVRIHPRFASSGQSKRSLLRQGRALVRVVQQLVDDGVFQIESSDQGFR